jgi:hypothetical protein
MMQYDVLATHLNANGVVAAYPVRVKGYQIKPGGTAGQIDFYDNASAASGTIRLSLDITTNTAVISTILPGEGIRFNNGVYVSLPASAGITVFYG